ncbi:LuxR C-terminal-related transcriptional regulator [Arcanobacterium hippocoleae]
MVLFLREAVKRKTVMGERPTELLTQEYLEKKAKQKQYEQFVQDVNELPEHLKPIFKLVIQAKSNKVIAEELHLSESTVRSYVSHILELTSSATRGELTLNAVRSGLA